MKKLRILVACEESQAVTKELRKLGHEAFSCDLVDCTGGHPEWHLKEDAIKLAYTQQWDMLIGFPPCTHLAVSGSLHFEKKRADGSQREAIEFFMKLYTAPIEMIALENPVNIIGGKYIQKWFPDLVEKYGLPIKATQTIQPYNFGHDASKRTCLWLKNLPQLTSTGYFPPRIVEGKKRWSNQTDSGQNRLGPSEDRATLRSKTYSGIAEAMANQWAK